MTVPVLVDTSALYAVLDAASAVHREAATAWSKLVAGAEAHEYAPRTHHGIVVETSALVQRRLGMAALRDLHDGLLGALEIDWVDESLHNSALTAMLAADRRGVSLVDWTSFELMRAGRIDHALAFDADFENQGFERFR